MAMVNVDGEDFEVDGITFDDDDLTAMRIALLQTNYLTSPELSFDTQRFDLAAKAILEQVFPGAEFRK